MDSPVLFGVDDLLQHGVQHSVGGNLGNLNPSVGELLLHVGHPDPDLLELGVLDVAGLVGIVLLEHLLQLYLRRLPSERGKTKRGRNNKRERIVRGGARVGWE